MEFFIEILLGFCIGYIPMYLLYLFTKDYL